MSTNTALIAILNEAVMMLVGMVPAHIELQSLTRRRRKINPKAQEIVDTIGIHGSDNDGFPTLLKVCGGKHISRRKVGMTWHFKWKGQINPLATWMLTKSCLQEEGVTEWKNGGKDWKTVPRWVQEAFQILLRQCIEKSCKDVILQAIVQDPDNPGYPLLVDTQFHPHQSLNGAIVAQEVDEDGHYAWKEDGTPHIAPRRDVRIISKGMVQVGDEHHEVNAARITTGDGNLIPSIVYLDDGRCVAGRPLPCVFMREIDHKKLVLKGGQRLFGFAVGLVSQEVLAHWNQVNPQFPIQHIENKIGDAEQLLVVYPQGAAQMGCLTYVYDDKNFRKIDLGRPNLRVISFLSGKPVLPANDSIELPAGSDDQGRPIPVPLLCRVTEALGAIYVNVSGRLEDTRRSQGRFKGDETQPQAKPISDGMKLLNWSYGSCQGPRSVALAVRIAEQNLNLDAMREQGILQGEVPTAVAVAAWQTRSDEIVRDIKAKLRAAKKNVLSESDGQPTLERICGGEINPENIRRVYDFTDGEELTPLAAWLLETETVKSLGITEWNFNSWLLMFCHRQLFKQLVEANGHEIPAQPEAPTQSTQTASKPKGKKKGGHRRRQRRTGSTESAST